MTIVAGAKGVLRQAQLAQKTDGLETMLAVCLLSERTEKTRSRLLALCEDCRWKRSKKYGPNRNMRQTKVQRSTH